MAFPFVAALVFVAEGASFPFAVEAEVFVVVEEEVFVVEAEVFVVEEEVFAVEAGVFAVEEPLVWGSYQRV